MKTTTFLIFLIGFPIYVHMLSVCEGTYIDADLQGACSNPGSKCTTKFDQVGECKNILFAFGGPACCNNDQDSDDFQTNEKCDDSKKTNYRRLYCKKGYVFHVGDKNYKANKGSSKDCDFNSDCDAGSYCVLVNTNPTIRKCYDIDTEEASAFVVIIVIIVILLIIGAIVASIIVCCCCCRKRKNGNGNAGYDQQNQARQSPTTTH
ncbi:unnamed protein product [Caenorhabditis angaria]|uniref:Domain of unknown function DX domain-containing protein n=1 Tax=Caenorhabditis angaria TaxID=860376 RepID=A0A9P1N230_9PELO|nr:unnamed protein product [Caenorhabditis angaria]